MRRGGNAPSFEGGGKHEDLVCCSNAEYRELSPREMTMADEARSRPGLQV